MLQILQLGDGRQISKAEALTHLKVFEVFAACHMGNVFKIAAGNDENLEIGHIVQEGKVSHG